MMRKATAVLVVIVAVFLAGCVDSSRAILQEPSQALRENITKDYPDKETTLKAMRSVMHGGLLISDKAMFGNRLLVVTEDYYLAKYDYIPVVHKNDEGKAFGKYHPGHHQIEWSKLRVITIKGPYKLENDPFRRGILGVDYYSVYLSDHDGFLSRNHRIHFADLEYAQHFAALVLRMAELWDNREVKLNP